MEKIELKPVCPICKEEMRKATGTEFEYMNMIYSGYYCKEHLTGFDKK